MPRAWINRLDGNKLKISPYGLAVNNLFVIAEPRLSATMAEGGAVW